MESSTVIFFPDDTQKTGLKKPLFLYPVSGAPLLAWLAQSMAEAGTSRFFLICPGAWAEEARDCFPESCRLTVCADQDPSDLLHVFLSTTPLAEQSICVVMGPAAFFRADDFLEDSPKGACVCRVSRRLMMEALDDEIPFGRFLKAQGQTYTDRDGFHSVSSPAELGLLSRRINRERLIALQGQGVQVWDMDNCYVDPRAAVAGGTELLPGAILRGRTRVGGGCVIGPNSLLENARVEDGAVVNASQVYDSMIGAGCHVGPFAHIRPGTELGSGAKAGAFVELKNASIGENTKVPHLSYVGDADVGPGSNIGCGTVTANFDRVEKNRTVLGARTFVGCNTCLVAPVELGDEAYIAAGSVITQNVPAQALGVARSRQTNKKDWSAKHKK